MAAGTPDLLWGVVMDPITLDGKQTSGVVTGDGVGLRVRVRADEWGRLSLSPGRPVRFAGAGQAGNYLLASATPEPPDVLLVLLPMA